MGMQGFILAALLIATPLCHGESLQETAVEDSLTSQAMGFLTALLGPNKARVTVSVSGEMRHTQSSTSISVPSIPNSNPQTPPQSKPPVKQMSNSLPGYVHRLIGSNITVPPGGFTDYAQGTALPPQTMPTQQAAPVPQRQPDMIAIHQSHENSDVSDGFVVKKVLVSVVLDSQISPAQGKEVARILPAVLHLDSTRGDNLTILRANLFPPWKTTLLNFENNPKTATNVFILLGALILTLLFGFIIYVTAMRVVKTFVSELAAARRAQAEEDKNDALNGGPDKNALPEILPDGIPSLSGPDASLDDAGAAPLALGQRFDFLSSKQPQELGLLLAAESPEDIALLFASLAGSNPELAAALFSALPLKKQKETSQALMGINIADPDRLNAVENRLKDLVEFGMRGPERLGRILSRLPIDEREAVVSGISPQNPEAAQELEKSLFAFEDLAGLKEAELRRVIMGANYQEWGMALRGAPQNMIDAVLKLIPEGARIIARESMESPQPRTKVLEMRSRILSHALGLASRGEISLQEKNASELI